MAKARRELTESLKRVDTVLELVDARLPRASSNPMLRDMIGRKPKALVMTRCDLADPVQTRRWEQQLRADGPVVCVDARTGSGIRDVLPALEQAAAEKRQRDAARGIRPRPLRTLVVGIPNVGKSSLINRLAGRAATKTGDRPGITKTQQWIRLGNVELLDTPGVLWPKFEDETSAYILAVSGAIKAEILDPSVVCAYFLVWCASHYPDALRSRYGITALPDTTWTGPAEGWEAVEPVLAQIAQRRGLIGAGGKEDLERAAQVVLREVQTGVLGRMTFEWAESGPLKPAPPAPAE
ncbi:MAG: ribosome biogenesis GTPase YlqF [Alicyclobacillaceae bacterium]|nr:ribosome biogenesis GTPase YlqF [Alicyclobacillaceae bacterium]